VVFVYTQGLVVTQEISLILTKVYTLFGSAVCNCTLLPPLLACCCTSPDSTHIASAVPLSAAQALTDIKNRNIFTALPDFGAKTSHASEYACVVQKSR
jgi:hypothetical protein